MFAMDVAEGWYASGTFWAGAGAVVGVLGAAGVIWVTLTVGFPRRRLYYRMQAVAPLMTAPERVRGDLELRHRGRVLADPRALTIELVSKGRQDIPSDAYDNGEPLRLDLRARSWRYSRSYPSPRLCADQWSRLTAQR